MWAWHDKMNICNINCFTLEKHLVKPKKEFWTLFFFFFFTKPVMPYLETEKSDRKNGDETNHGFTWSSCCSPLTPITYDSRISTRIVSTDWFETLNLEVSCCQPEICSRHILQFHYLILTLEIGLPCLIKDHLYPSIYVS